MNSLTDKILATIPNGTPHFEVMDSLNALLASLIIHASDGSDLEQSKLLSVVQSDLAEKVGGVN